MVFLGIISVRGILCHDKRFVKMQTTALAAYGGRRRGERLRGASEKHLTAAVWMFAFSPFFTLIIGPY
jgi:hypothetical protein